MAANLQYTVCPNVTWKLNAKDFKSIYQFYVLRYVLMKTIQLFGIFYLQGYKPPDEGPSEYQSIPLNKIEDFGVHCKQ